MTTLGNNNQWFKVSPTPGNQLDSLFLAHFFFTKQTVWTRSEAFSGHEYLLNRGGRIREVSGKANDVKTETMCSTENNAELQTTCKSGIYETVTATSAP